jgi:glycosyltransferase involved in cell wall biosynthesis
MKSPAPLISVGIPCYNRPAELERLLGQVRTQSHKELEILISNNCSTDPSIDSICRAAANDDSRIKYFRQAVNIGAARNHIFLLRAASSELFLFLADDDEISGDYIEELTTKILACPKASMIGGRGIRYLDNQLWYNYEYHTSEGKTCFERLSALLPLAFNNHWVFEQYWYGLFRIKKHPPALSLDFKSTLFRIFWLSEQGPLGHAPKAIYTKHTTSKELESHQAGSAYRRHRILSLFRDDHLQSVQQCLPICFQITAIISKSKNLNAVEKLLLIKSLWSDFAVKCLDCEIEPYKTYVKRALVRLRSLASATFLQSDTKPR